MMGFRPLLMLGLAAGFLLAGWNGVVAVLALDAIFPTS